MRRPGQTLAAAGADHQLTLWDLALEEDPEAESAVHGRDDLQGIPPQLFFVHQGQNEIKELHWHAQLPGVLGSTAEDSFHMLKPANSCVRPFERVAPRRTRRTDEHNSRGRLARPAFTCDSWRLLCLSTGAMDLPPSSVLPMRFNATNTDTCRPSAARPAEGRERCPKGNI